MKGQTFFSILEVSSTEYTEKSASWSRVGDSPQITPITQIEFRSRRTRARPGTDVAASQAVICEICEICG